MARCGQGICRLCHFSFNKINEMGKNVAFGHGKQARVDIGVDARGQRGGGGRGLGQGGQNLPLASCAVVEKLSAAPGRVGDRFAMGGVVDAVGPGEEPVERVAERGEVAIGGRDQRG